MKKWGILLCLGLILMSSSALAQNDWEVMNPENPPDPMCGHSLVRTTPEVIFAFGGKRQSTVVNDLDEFSNNTWTKVESVGTSPAASEGHAAWSYDEKMYVFGGKGSSNSLYNDLWRYDSVTRSWEEVAAGAVRPSPRYGHAVDVAEDGKVYISGGTDAGGKALNDLWVMNTDYSFTQLFGNLYHTSNHKIHVVGNSLYLFGIPGVVSQYLIPTDRWVQTDVKDLYPNGYFSSVAIPGSHSSSALSPKIRLQASQADTRIYLFGGLTGDGQESDKVYEFNPSGSTLTEMSQRMPMPLYNGAAAPYGPGILLFGGISNGELSNTTMLFSPNPGILRDPVAGITANGQTGPVTIQPQDMLSVNISLDTGDWAGHQAYWWLLIETPFGFYYYDLTASWQPGFDVTYQGPLFGFNDVPVLNFSGLPQGTYNCYFGVTMSDSGLLYYSYVPVIVAP